VDADGRNLRLLASDARMDWWPAWSPDGSKIAFTAVQEGEERGRALAKTSIRVVDVATGHQTDVTSRQVSHVSPPSWSPSGDQLAFAGFSLVSDYALGTIQRRNGAVYIATLATGEITPIGGNRLANAVLVSWSPVNDEILVYVYDTTGVGFDRQMTGIFLLNAVTGTVEALTQRSQDVGPPFWAPDGSRFAFIEGDSVVRIRWLPGRREAAIGVARPVVTLTWAPDGEALLVVPANAHQPATMIPLPDGPGTQTDVLLPFDFAISGAGPQWSPVNPIEPGRPPTVGGTALDPPRHRVPSSDDRSVQAS
jgi:Tol biopolymer transport system component